ncbi:hypothetical protein GH714_030654 [Hevea brasiliensis]|uniref:C3H1-type domain-containing protein n=1 Tax=Hevea brasiliensis TaxID=3981 RepID=A0A6A6LQP8_HEVBR|nr:hypothetical protein GH714_030654 [Hevea brasiliensis]
MIWKPLRLRGKCPFTTGKGQCPYDLTCRFYGRHEDGATGNSSNAVKKSYEINGLNKDVQKLLWKNKIKFPKADAKLRSLGLMGPGNSRVKKQDDGEVDQNSENDSHTTDGNGCGEVVRELADKWECSLGVLTEENADEIITTDEVRSLKKAKSVIEEKCCSSEEANGLSIPEKDLENGCPEMESVVTDGALVETDGSLNTHPREKKLIDFRGKLYLAPLTIVGSLPF